MPQSMLKMRRASSLRAAPLHPVEARCRAEASRVQSMVKMKPAVFLEQPLDTQTRLGAGRIRVQSMVKMSLVSSLRAAPQHPAAEARC